MNYRVRVSSGSPSVSSGSALVVRVEYIQHSLFPAMNGLDLDFLIQRFDALSVNFYSGLDASLVRFIPIVDLSL